MAHRKDSTMTEEQRECDHGMWDDVGDWRKEIEYVSGTLRYPVFCCYCGLRAMEIYTFACRETDDGEEVC